MDLPGPYLLYTAASEKASPIRPASERVEQEVVKLKKQTEIDPTHVNSWLSLANAYRKLGRKQDAVRETAVFNLLKDKQEVLAPPEEKLHLAGKAPGTKQ